MATRIFNVEIEYQEACDGKVFCDTIFKTNRNVVAKNVVDAVMKAKKEFEKPERSKNDEGKTEVYTKANICPINVELLAEA